MDLASKKNVTPRQPPQKPVNHVGKCRSNLSADWLWWDKTHLASKHLPQRSSPHKKEPIIWKNTKRNRLSFGPGGTKSTLLASKSLNKAATTRRSQSYGKIQSATGCALALVGQNPPCQQTPATPQQPPQKGANHMEKYNPHLGADWLR